MKLKVVYTFCLLFFINSFLNAQVKLSDSEAKSLKGKVVEKSKKTTSIISNFIQSKHLSFLSKDIISKGELVFKSPNLIKWSYVTPFKYSVIFKENKLFVNDDGTKSDIDISSNKVFKELNNLIVSSVKGDMFDDDKFNIKYYKSGKDYLVVFDAKDDSVKSFINTFELTFDSNSYNVLKVKMVESSEDYTLIEFKNHQINKPIRDEVFVN